MPDLVTIPPMPAANAEALLTAARDQAAIHRHVCGTYTVHADLITGGADRIAEVIGGESDIRQPLSPEAIDDLRSRLLGWSPIDTAPKDGTEVLLWAGGAISGYWTTEREPNGNTPEPGEDGVWRGAWSGRPLYLEWHHKPTHWRPISPPSDSSREDGS